MPAPRTLIAISLALLLGALAAGSAAAAQRAGNPRSARSAHRQVRHSKRASCARPSSHRTRARTCARVRPHTRRPAPAPTPAPVPAATEASRSAAASIAEALATPCQNTEVTPEAGNVALVEAAVLCLINHERASHGERPLRLNADLQRAAAEHDQELISADYFAHVSPSGLTPVDRIRATGYVPGPSFGYVLGENLAWGTLGLSTAQSIVTAWIASPGHLANILESQYVDTGIAVLPSVPPSLSGGEQGATYAQEFGVILG